MNNGIVRKIIVLAALTVLSGCATYDSKPILSAADAQAAIQVEVRVLEPLPVDDAVAALDLASGFSLADQ